MSKFDNVSIGGTPKQQMEAHRNRTQTEQQSEPQTTREEPRQTQPRYASNRSLAGIVRRSMPRRATNALLSSTIEAFRSIPDMMAGGVLEPAVAAGDIALLPLDSDLEGTEISAVLVCRRAGNDVAVMNLGLAVTVSENLGELYIPQTEQDRRDGRNSINVIRTPSDIYEESNHYRQAIERIVSEYPEYAGCKVHHVGQMIVQKDIDLSNVEQLRRIMFRSIDATEGFLVDVGVVQDNQRFNLIDYADIDTRLTVRVNMGQADEKDDLGNLVRSDITVSLITRDTVEENGVRKTKTIPQTVVKGYIDAVFVDVDDSNLGSHWTEKNTQCYVPMFVMTTLDTDEGGVTLPHLIGAVATTNMLADKNLWVANFRPEYAHHYKYRFVGGLGREVPMIGSPISRNGANETLGVIKPTTDFDFVGFCREAFYMNDLVVGMDIEQGGAISSIQEVIWDAARGERDGLEAFVSAADEAFNGCFSRAWEDAGRPELVYTDMTLIPIGTFVDENGELRDIRNIDLVYLQNMDIDPDTIEDFNTALYNGDIDEYRRLSDLTRILRGVAQTMEITGYAHRVFFTNAFFEVAAQAVEDAGVILAVDSQVNMDNVRTRGVRQLRQRGTRGQDGLFRRNSGSRASSVGRSVRRRTSNRYHR